MAGHLIRACGVGSGDGRDAVVEREARIDDDEAVVGVEQALGYLVLLSLF
jgi:hypothetical protein